MSAILSADDLNDFIAPGIACIKPVETLPLQDPLPGSDSYEVTTEDKVAEDNAPPAQITLTDCLACSGCVTSAETVLISLQSHAEVLSALDSEVAIPAADLRAASISALQNSGRNYFRANDASESLYRPHLAGKVFVASVSPQVRASLASTYGTSEREAGWMIEQLLCGPHGISSGGSYGNRFAWVVDTNPMRAASLAIEADELLPLNSALNGSKSPRLTSACPGWICFAEKKHPHIIPHLSHLKSPQALTGTLIKSVLGAKLGLLPHQIWHLAVMPCFDKKLEAARAELTDKYWHEGLVSPSHHTPTTTRDVDCVITSREILMLADARGISFPALPRKPLIREVQLPFPDLHIQSFLHDSHLRSNGSPGAGTSGGFLAHVLAVQQAHYPNSVIETIRGRNADMTEFTVRSPEGIHFQGARYYGFRNIQNVVQKLRPPKASRLPGRKAVAARSHNDKIPKSNSTNSKASAYHYVEVMACPGGCTNGGGQIKLTDLSELQAVQTGATSQKEWLALVDETYFSMDEDSTDGAGESGMVVDPNNTEDVVNGISHTKIRHLVDHWSEVTGVTQEKLLYTTFNAVDSDVGANTVTKMEHVVELASQAGGGW